MHIAQAAGMLVDIERLFHEGGQGLIALAARQAGMRGIILS